MWQSIQAVLVLSLFDQFYQIGPCTLQGPLATRHRVTLPLPHLTACNITYIVTKG